jgi:hypothetical protein
MLIKMGLVDAVIEYLSDRNEFDEAFKMAKQGAKHKVSPKLKNKHSEKIQN